MSNPTNKDLSSAFFATHLAALPVLTILRGFSPSQTVELCHKAVSAGIRLVEVPVQGRDSLAALEAAVNAVGDHLIVGAGTVRSTELVATVAQAGAAFTVAPGWDDEVATASITAGLPHLPGVFTPTEVHAAMTAGLTWLKFFPASLGGPAWISALRGPFPTANFVATGGITADNAPTFLAAGAAGVSFGASFAEVDPAAFAALARA